MQEQFVDSVFKLSLDLWHHFVLVFNQIGEGLISRLVFDSFGEEVLEVDRLTVALGHFFVLVVVVDVREFVLDLRVRKAGPFYSRESHLVLLHVVVDVLVEVLAHICLHDYREVISIPISLSSGVESKDHRIEIVACKHI